MQEGMPNFTKEYLNQLSEEQLEQLVQQQQQLMMMQQLQQQQVNYSAKKPTTTKKSISRPKSAKTQGVGIKSLRPASASKKSGATMASYNGFQPYIAKSNTQKRLVQAATAKMPKKKKSKKQLLNNLAAQGVMMNNFFPALEG